VLEERRNSHNCTLETWTHQIYNVLCKKSHCLVLSCSYFSRYKYISPTTKYSKRVNRWLFTIQELIWDLPVMAMKQRPVVYMCGMLNCEFPPGLRDTGLELHGFYFLRDGPDDSFCSTILLVSIWDTL
jgi:hypothetical protein